QSYSSRSALSIPSGFSFIQGLLSSLSSPFISLLSSVSSDTSTHLTTLTDMTSETFTTLDSIVVKAFTQTIEKGRDLETKVKECYANGMKDSAKRAKNHASVMSAIAMSVAASHHAENTARAAMKAQQSSTILVKEALEAKKRAQKEKGRRRVEFAAISTAAQAAAQEATQMAKIRMRQANDAQKNADKAEERKRMILEKAEDLWRIWDEDDRRRHQQSYLERYKTKDSHKFPPIESHSLSSRRKRERVNKSEVVLPSGRSERGAHVTIPGLDETVETPESLLMETVLKHKPASSTDIVVSHLLPLTPPEALSFHKEITDAKSIMNNVLDPVKEGLSKEFKTIFGNVEKVTGLINSIRERTIKYMDQIEHERSELVQWEVDHYSSPPSLVAPITSEGRSTPIEQKSGNAGKGSKGGSGSSSSSKKDKGRSTPSQEHAEDVTEGVETLSIEPNPLVSQYIPPSNSNEIVFSPAFESVSLPNGSRLSTRVVMSEFLVSLFQRGWITEGMWERLCSECIDVEKSVVVASLSLQNEASSDDNEDINTQSVQHSPSSEEVEDSTRPSQHESPRNQHGKQYLSVQSPVSAQSFSYLGTDTVPHTTSFPVQVIGKLKWTDEQREIEEKVRKTMEDEMKRKEDDGGAKKKGGKKPGKKGEDESETISPVFFPSFVHSCKVSDKEIDMQQQEEEGEEEGEEEEEKTVVSKPGVSSK
ncbi:hypothetical protein ADUPG1_007084, partial [Aduncisulcus paluster]